MGTMIQTILDAPWAMSEEGLKWLLSLAECDTTALSTMAGKRAPDSFRATIRNGIAIVPVHGPLFKKANFFIDLFGASAYDQLIQDIHTLARNPDMSAIVMDIDSPGGEASGIAELADSVYQLRGRLPVHAYIGGTGASTAYWLASAANQIHASETAILGSIGVQTATHTGRSQGEIKFVSAQSPNKNRDPSTEEGAAEVQRVINDLAAVFNNSVARNRGISTDGLARQGAEPIKIPMDVEHNNIPLKALKDLPNAVSEKGCRYHQDDSERFERRLKICWLPG